jgi:hypothetical protein
VSTSDRILRSSLNPTLTARFARISDLTIKIVAPSTKSSSEEAILVFSATVFPDGDIWAVKAHDKEQEERANGSDIKVYDELFVRHWDDWKPTAGQRKQLQVVRLAKGAAAAQAEQDSSAEDFELIHPNEGRWTLESDSTPEASAAGGSRPKILAPLKGTKLVSDGVSSCAAVPRLTLSSSP